MISFYENISDNKLGALCKKIAPIQQRVFEMMHSRGFNQSRTSFSDYPLNWSFTSKKNPFVVNIGIDYTDQPGTPYFEVYAAKYLEKNNKKFYLKKYIKNMISLKDLQSHAIEYMIQAIDESAHWSDKDLEEIP